jgi:hypothetical protein
MVDEPNETVVVDITTVNGGTELGVQRQTITIVDDDEPPVPDVTLSVDRAVIAEAGGVARFDITLSQITTVPVTVNLAFTGTASAGDYIASASQIVVAPGTTSGSISVTAVDDREDEADETIEVDIAALAGGTVTGVQRRSITIIDDDAPPKLAVTALTATPSGFTAEFATELEASRLHLHETQNISLGPADVILQGAAAGPVAGSLVVDRSGRRITFIKSGGPLEPDTYTVTMRSAVDGFIDVGGQLLDGNHDGTGGDDYAGSFTVNEPAANAITLAIPDISCVDLASQSTCRPVKQWGFL